MDREERPDIDAVYMAVCQTLTGRGGWPLNILVTPDREVKLLDFGIGERGILLMVYSLMVLPSGATILWAATKNDRYFWLVGTTWILIILFFIILDIWYHKVELAARRSSGAQAKPADAGK